MKPQILNLTSTLALPFDDWASFATLDRWGRLEAFAQDDTLTSEERQTASDAIDAMLGEYTNR